MRFSGPLSKMRTSNIDSLRYYLELDDDTITMNDLIGRTISIHWQGHMICSCGKQVTEFFRMNFCRNCFFEKPEAGEAIIRPELSKAHLGIADRDLEWEKAYQLQPHIVYLANSAGLKVGVTRANQKLTRWADQGAIEAIVLAETPNRYQAGIIEVALKEYLSDKTPWQRMVKGEDPIVDLVDSKSKIRPYLPDEVTSLYSLDNTTYRLHYPVNQYSTKVKSVNLQKEGDIEGVLNGIRGQYLLFEDGRVMNIRSHEGFVVDFEV